MPSSGKRSGFTPAKARRFCEAFFTFQTKTPPCVTNRRHDHLLLTRLRDNRIRKSGPNFLMFTLSGNRSSVLVPKIFARMKSSPSGTRRCCVSSLASDSRLTSQPNTCNFADKSSCVHPLRSRKSRTCFPIRFSGGETFLILATLAMSNEENVRFRSHQKACRRPGVLIRVVKQSPAIVIYHPNLPAVRDLPCLSRVFAKGTAKDCVFSLFSQFNGRKKTSIQSRYEN